MNEHNGKARGLHTVRALSFLITSPLPLDVSVHDTVCVSDFCEVRAERETCKRVLPLREEFALQVSRYVEGRGTWWSIEDLRRFVCLNTTFGNFAKVAPRAILTSSVSWAPDASVTCPLVRESLPVNAVSASGPAIVSARAVVPLGTPPPLVDLPPCVKNHAPKSKARRADPKYILFEAARENCLRCVRHKLEETTDVDPHAESDNLRHTVKDYAFVYGAVTVANYLEEYWPSIRRNAS